MYLRSLFYLALLLTTASLSGQSAAIDSLDRAFNRLAAEDHFSGGLLLARGDSVLLRRSYGFADFTNRRPLREDAVLELASVSKQFTAAGIALLVADGQLDLDEPVKTSLPELAAYPSLTARQLVHHTGGLPDYMSAAGEIDTLPDFVTNDFVLAYLRDRKPEARFPPGERYAYSNSGYLVLASLIERLSGRSFGDFLRERLFEPLGMTDTQVYRRRYESERRVDRFVPGYVWDGDRYVIPDSLEEFSFVRTLDGVVGDGMVNSTLDDLYRWDRALARGRLLDTTLLFTPGQTTAGESTDYGFGQKVRHHPKYGYTISHTGGWPGMATFVYRFPTTDRTLILLRNDGGGRNSRLNVLRNALHALHDLPLEAESLTELAAVPVDPAAVADYVATYALDEDFKFKIFVDDQNYLRLQGTDQSPDILLPTAEDNVFTVREVNAQIRFNRNADGEVYSLALLQGDRETEAKRE